MILEYKIKENDNFTNLKELIKVHFQISDRLLAKLKMNDRLFVNGKVASVRMPLNVNDVVTINIDFIEDNSNIVPTKMPLDIVFEDDALLVVNKPNRFPVHPSMDHFEDSLSNGVKYYFDEIGLKRKIRPVNRLDKDTSGLVVFAKNEYVQECLIRQMKCKQFTKEYIAICDGVFENSKGTINCPIARKENSIIERCVSPLGDSSITHYEVLQSSSNFTVVKCILETRKNTSNTRAYGTYWALTFRRYLIWYKFFFN